MKATYTDIFGEEFECIHLACSIGGETAFIELDGETGWCSAHLVEEY